MVSGGPGATKYFTASSFDDRLLCGHGDERSNLKGDSKVIQASAVEDLPRNCTFSPSDWKVLSEFWFPIGLKGDFTEKPLRVRLLDEVLVVYRTATGRIVVARDLCVHRGSPLSYGWVQGEEIVCGYHGYRYNAEGRCVLIPSNPEGAIPDKLRLKVYRSEERYGVIWVCLSGQPKNVIPDWRSEWEDQSFRWFTWGPHIWDCSPGRAIENFLDNAHFSFVHRGTFGQESSARMEDHDLKHYDDGFLMEFDYQASNPGDSPIDGQEQLHRKMSRRLTYPFFTRTSIHYPEGKEHIIHITVVPVSARRSQLLFLFCRNFDHHVPEETLVEWEAKILTEDKRFIESQKPEEIPLDLAAEVHVRADKASIAMRRWMIDIGLGGEFSA